MKDSVYGKGYSRSPVHRASKDGKLAVGCSAAVFDESYKKILLVQRADNGQWAVPGGYMDPGENFSEACAREVHEETGLVVVARRLISIYTTPHILLEYPDGNRWQLVVLHFECQLRGGALRPSGETPDLNFFTQSETEKLDLGMLDRFRVADSFAKKTETIIRNEFEL